MHQTKIETVWIGLLPLSNITILWIKSVAATTAWNYLNIIRLSPRTTMSCDKSPSLSLHSRLRERYFSQLRQQTNIEITTLSVRTPRTLIVMIAPVGYIVWVDDSMVLFWFIVRFCEAVVKAVDEVSVGLISQFSSRYPAKYYFLSKYFVSHFKGRMAQHVGVQ